MASRSFEVSDRAGNRLSIPAPEAYIGSRLLLPKILDYNSSSLREPVTNDLIRACQIANHFDEFDVVFMVETPVQDMEDDPEINFLRSMYIVFTHTNDHVYCLPASVESFRSWFALAEASIDGDLSTDPVLTVGVSTTSPLVLDPQSARVLFLAAKKGLPILPAAMVGGGGTCPVTNAGELVLLNAETLFIIIAAQAVRPYCPVFYGGVPGTFDLRVGIFSLGAPELAPMTKASLEMANFYGLPSFSATKYTDSFSLDVQCGSEKIMAAFAALVGGTDVIYGCGDLGAASVLSLEQIVIDLDIILAARRFFHGLRVDKERLAMQAIRNVGHGGHYLEQDHTLQFMRSGETFTPITYNRSVVFDQSNPQSVRAHDIVNTIIQEEPLPVISDGKLQRINSAVEKRRKELVASEGNAFLISS
jgi:trimethylamine--corrinoid protein Co-methyltransferase